MEDRSVKQLYVKNCVCGQDDVRQGCVLKIVCVCKCDGV